MSGKYNFEFDLYSENSLSIIANMIEPNSKVLEFGCAYGRLTKYLKEELNCIIDIIEIDEEAGKIAKQYSNQSIIGQEGNIETYTWLKKLQGNQYDYIIFADVLEHLKEPEQVLKKCKILLQSTGSILLSVPNIAHNDIIYDLLENKFCYRDVGLLDSTHIHFFTYYTLCDMIQKCGYKILVERATHTNITELQIQYDKYPKEIQKYLKNRYLGNVYQFIFQITRENGGIKEYRKVGINQPQTYRSSIFVKTDTDKVFSEYNCIQFDFIPSTNTFRCDVKDYKNIVELRIDPMEEMCIIEIVDVKGFWDEAWHELEIAESNGFKYENKYYFDTQDPQLMVRIPSGVTIEQFQIEIKFMEYSSENIKKYIADILNIWGSCNKKREQLDDRYREESRKYYKQIEELQQTNKDYSRQIEELQQINKDCSEQVEKLQQINKSYGEQIEELQQTNKQCAMQIQSLSWDIQNILRSTSWKITKPVRSIKLFLKKQKDTYKIIEYPWKFLWYTKNYSFSYAINKIKLFFSRKQPVVLSDEIRKIEEHTEFSKKIKFSIIVPLYNTPQRFLEEMIESCINQTYKNWELCLADGSDREHEYIENYIKQMQKKDSRILYKKLDKNMGISRNTNSCVDMATGEYIALFDHDDLLHPSALYEYMKVICEKDAEFIYCDEDKVSEDGKRHYDPYYKPDFSIDMLRSNNYICHFTVFKKELLKKTGLFRTEFDGAQDHDMILRLVECTDKIVHIPKILYHWRVSDSSVARDPYAKSYTIEHGINAVSEHLKRCKLLATVSSTEGHPNFYRICYKIENNPKVSILIPNKDHIIDLKRCINSILDKTTYKNYEIIIIENNSIEKETFEYYKKLEKNKNIKIITYIPPSNEFNYSAINNYGVKFATGEYILLLNNDIEIITSNWIEEMLMFAQREDVGAVGAKLYYPNDTIQHGGVILGLGGVAGHSHKHYQRNSAGYFRRLQIQQNLSAVTAACLLMRKSIFYEVGQLDQELFKVAFNDVDLCMRIRKAGYLIVWTPFAEAYHYESISRGLEDTLEKQVRFQNEILSFKTRWKKELEEGDPYYNCNLTLNSEDFSIKQ